MFETIIVPLDGSLFAEQAVGTAATLAQRSGADLVLIRVHETYLFEATDYSIADDLSRQDQEQYLAEIAERVESLFGLVPQRVLLDGVVDTAICNFASGFESPLIVISTHGRTGFSRLWLGSVADAIVRHASTPVLMLRHRGDGDGELTRTHHFRHLLVPLDGARFAEVALAPAAALAAAFRAKLTLLRVVAPVNVPVPLYAAPYVAPPIDDDEETLNSRLEGAEDYARALATKVRLDVRGLEVDTVVRVQDSPAPAILDAACAQGVDTIAIATHGRGVSRLVVASVTDKVLRGGPEAVLVLRPEVDA
jgi:nucleotide-binding universal stress UspA family protein